MRASRRKRSTTLGLLTAAVRRYFDRDGLLELQVSRRNDDAEPPFADHALDHVLVGDQAPRSKCCVLWARAARGWNPWRRSVTRGRLGRLDRVGRFFRYPSSSTRTPPAGKRSARGCLADGNRGSPRHLAMPRSASQQADGLKNMNSRWARRTWSPNARTFRRPLGREEPPADQVPLRDPASASSKRPASSRKNAWRLEIWGARGRDRVRRPPDRDHVGRRVSQLADAHDRQGRLPGGALQARIHHRGDLVLVVVQKADGSLRAPTRSDQARAHQERDGHAATKSRRVRTRAIAA